MLADLNADVRRIDHAYGVSSLKKQAELPPLRASAIGIETVFNHLKCKRAPGGG